MIAVTVDKVDNFVAKLQRKGVNVRWNGWNIIFFKANKRAATNPEGVRNGNEWGFERVVSPDSNGNWLVDYGLTRAVNA